MFHIKNKSGLVTYRGYVIREGNFPWSTEPTWFFQHDDAEDEFDLRRGWASSLEDAKAEIDEQIESRINR